MPFIMTAKDWTLLRLRNKYYVYLRNRREHAEAHCIPVYRKKIHNITKVNNNQKPYADYGIGLFYWRNKYNK